MHSMCNELAVSREHMRFSAVINVIYESVVSSKAQEFLCSNSMSGR